MLATRKGERLSGNDEGGGQGGGRQDLPLLASAQSPRIVEEILPAVATQDRWQAGCHIIWRRARDTLRRRRAHIRTEDICHLQRNTPTKPASVRRGLLHLRGSVFTIVGKM